MVDELGYAGNEAARRYLDGEITREEAVDWLDRQHLLMIESATAKSLIPPAAEKEEVRAMRVSGLKGQRTTGVVTLACLI